MFDIIIPFTQEFNYDDAEANWVELKYALRSIEKNLSGWRDIYVIGDEPKPFKDLIHFYFLDDGICKDHRIYNKMLLACGIDSVSDDFIMYHNDHFLLKPLAANEIKYWHEGAIREYQNENMGTRFATMVNETGERFPDGKFFDGHYPIIFNKTLLRQLKNEWAGKYLLKSFYCNYHAIEGEYRKNCKIVGSFPKEQVRKIINGHLFFSTNAICTPTVEVLEEMFPEKSKFEL